MVSGRTAPTPFKKTFNEVYQVPGYHQKCKISLRLASSSPKGYDAFNLFVSYLEKMEHCYETAEGYVDTIALI
uniref:Uncharacterized protein n=1 Tax=Romanomermis culicivorax TaxID=13658 RepID=A0A915KG56_ROMCU